jgi:hypothetical protein
MVLACASLVFVGAGLAACGDDNQTSRLTSPTAGRAATTVPASPTTPGTTGTAAPGGVRTGIAAVDRAIAAVLAADERVLGEMLVLQPVRCEAEPVGVGGPPPCRDGEADGTPVEVIATAQCEGAYVRPDELRLTSIVADAAELYAVYRAPDNYFPSGLYVAVFERPADAQGRRDAFELVLDNEGIAGINFGCGQGAAQLVETRGLREAIAGPEGG